MACIAPGIIGMQNSWKKKLGEKHDTSSLHGSCCEGDQETTAPASSTRQSDTVQRQPSNGPVAVKPRKRRLPFTFQMFTESHQIWRGDFFSVSGPYGGKV